MGEPTDHRFRVLGIDPGLNITGYAVVDFPGGPPAIIEAGAIRPPNRGALADRIAALHEEVADLVAQTRPDLLAVETLYAHYKHPRTSILMAHARGVILLAARQAGVGIRDLPATNVKKSLTGNGHATKRQMQLAVQQECGLDAPPEPADVADALAIALAAGRHEGRR